MNRNKIQTYAEHYKQIISDPRFRNNWEPTDAEIVAEIKRKNAAWLDYAINEQEVE